MTVLIILLGVYSVYTTFRIRDIKAANRIETTSLIEENQRLKELEGKSDFWRNKYQKLLTGKNV